MRNERNVLVLCDQKSARSQMVEASLRKHGRDRFTVYSAGAQPSVIDPLTFRMMEEAGLSLEGQRAAFREVRDGIERRVLEWLRDPEVGLVGGRR